jgi:hypothetical protein
MMMGRLTVVAASPQALQEVQQLRKPHRISSYSLCSRFSALSALSAPRIVKSFGLTCHRCRALPIVLVVSFRSHPAFSKFSSKSRVCSASSPRINDLNRHRRFRCYRATILVKGHHFLLCELFNLLLPECAVGFSRFDAALVDALLSAIFGLRSRSTCDSARSVAFMPGVLEVPENPTTPVQQVVGSVHDLDAFTRRAVPIRLETIPNIGTATCAAVAPAQCAARSTQSPHASGKVSIGKGGNSPRRSSRMDQSGSSQS